MTANTTARPVKLSEAQKRVLHAMGDKDSTLAYQVGSGEIYVSSIRVCFRATIDALTKAGIVKRDAWQGKPVARWMLTKVGRAAFEQMRAEGDKGE